MDRSALPHFGGRAFGSRRVTARPDPSHALEKPKEVLAEISLKAMLLEPHGSVIKIGFYICHLGEENRNCVVTIAAVSCPGTMSNM